VEADGIESLDYWHFFEIRDHEGVDEIDQLMDADCDEEVIRIVVDD